MALPDLGELKRQANEAIMQHANEIVVLLDSIEVNLNCPYLYAAFLELALYIRVNGDIGAYEDYTPEGLIQQFREEHAQEILQQTALGGTLDEIDGPDKIKPGTVVH